MTQIDVGKFKGNIHYCASEAIYEGLTKDDGDVYLIPAHPIVLSTSEPSGTAIDGTIWIQYDNSS